jgi:hypothetical protein
MFNPNQESLNFNDTLSLNVPNDFVIGQSNLEAIEQTLSKFNLFHLQDFYYDPCDCLFDALEIFHHFHYTYIEI